MFSEDYSKPNILKCNQYGCPNTLTFSIHYSYHSDLRQTYDTPFYMTLWDVSEWFYRKFMIWYQYWEFNKTAKNIHIHGLIASKKRLNFSCQTTISKNPIWKSKYILIFGLTCYVSLHKTPNIGVAANKWMRNTQIYKNMFFDTALKEQNTSGCKKF